MDGQAAAHWGADAVDLRETSLPGLKARFAVERAPACGRVLEIGCGDGKILRTLARHKRGLELYGCDVREPTRRADVFEFQRMDRNVPFASASMDAVLVFDVLEHVPEPLHLIAEAARVLRAEGRLIAFVPVEGETRSFYELFRRLLGRDTYVVTKEHIQAFTHRAARSIIEDRFDIQDIRYAYHLLGHLMDASFFAAARARRLRDFWWQANVFYNPGMKNTGAGMSLMNRLLIVANAVAAVESTFLSRVRAGSAGILVDAVVRPER
jgi:SAM-dependent methyltransferase